MNKDLDRLQHMSEACELLLRATDCEYSDYLNNRDKQAAVERYFEILGEAAKMVSDETQQAHPEIPWRTAGDTRNFIIHSYIKVSPQRLWETAEKDIPKLFLQVRHLLGVYGDGWLPCTDHLLGPSDTDCINHILGCIRSLRDADSQDADADKKEAFICRQHSVAGENASQLTRKFRLAHSQIDWKTIVANGERVNSISKNPLFAVELGEMTKWLIAQESALISILQKD